MSTNKKKSEKLIESEKLLEKLEERHKEFFDKVRGKRLCDFSLEDIRHAALVVFPDIANIKNMDKEESK